MDTVTSRAKEYHVTEVVESPTATNIEAGKACDAGPVLDYAGSAEKTNPEEIKLVRKLDVWMLVCTTRDRYLISYALVTEHGSEGSRCYGFSTS